MVLSLTIQGNSVLVSDGRQVAEIGTDGTLVISDYVLTIGDKSVIIKPLE